LKDREALDIPKRELNKRNSVAVSGLKYGFFYTLTISAPEQGWSEFEDTARKMISSFHFTEKTEDWVQPGSGGLIDKLEILKETI